MPVSVSTSTTARCTPNGNVGGAWNSCATLSSPSRPSAAARDASSAQESAGSGVPATWKRPRAEVEHHVGRARLEVVGGEILRLLDDRVGRQPAADAADLRRLRAERPGALRDLVRVALDDRDPLDREPEPLGGDHRERRLVALAVRERARAQDRAAVRRDLDLAELGLADAGS